MPPASKHTRRLLPFGAAMVAVTAVGIFVLAWFWYRGLFYDVRSFQGDAVLEDKGFWSYPRYRVVMPACDAAGETTQRFVLRGLPRERLTLTLRVLDTRPRNGQSFTAIVDDYRNLPWHVGVSIKDDTGASICQVSENLTNWEVAVSQPEVSLWHPRARDILFDNPRQYEVVLTFKPISTSAPPLCVEPILGGGGNELP